MEVGNSTEGMVLEELVRTRSRNLLDGSPSSDGGLGIIEPLVTEVLHVVSIHMGDSLGNFRSGSSSSLEEDLSGNFVLSLEESVLSHELVVVSVSSSEDLNFGHESSVDSGDGHTGIGHLSGEDLVSEEVVSEDTRIRVSEVVS